jgi:hypothetical protein
MAEDGDPFAGIEPTQEDLRGTQFKTGQIAGTSFIGRVSGFDNG